MAHFAKIDENNFVVEILVVDNSLENRGQEFLATDLGLGGTWIQTSYNGKFRKQFAAIGYKYDSVADLFIAPKPFESWILNQNYDWEAPIEYPQDGKDYRWNEDLGEWINA